MPNFLSPPGSVADPILFKIKKKKKKNYGDICWYLGAGALNMQSLEEVLPKVETGTNALASSSF